MTDLCGAGSQHRPAPQGQCVNVGVQGICPVVLGNIVSAPIIGVHSEALGRLPGPAARCNAARHIACTVRHAKYSEAGLRHHCCLHFNSPDTSSYDADSMPMLLLRSFLTSSSICNSTCRSALSRSHVWVMQQQPRSTVTQQLSLPGRQQILAKPCQEELHWFTASSLTMISASFQRRTKSRVTKQVQVQVTLRGMTKNYAMQHQEWDGVYQEKPALCYVVSCCPSLP